MTDQSPPGLSSSQAKVLLAKYGPNHVAEQSSGWWQILTRQFKSPFIYLLLGAAAVSGLLSSLTDTMAILVFIIVNTVLGFYQEFTSQQTLRSLENYFKFHTQVFRDGQIKEIPNSGLVPGDVIRLRPGHIIPADVKFLHTSNLMLNESSVSGESVPVPKSSGEVGLAGTSLSVGSAIALITATGRASTLGRIISESQTGSTSTFEKDIASFSAFVLKLVLITLSALFVVNLFIKGPQADLVELLLFCIALAVSVIPEALPVVITFSLSRGAARLAKNKVVIKKLLSIEDLGGIQVLATDKTGTLTESRMSVYRTYPDSSPDLRLWALAASEDTFTASNNPDPFDTALDRSLAGDQKKLLSAMSLVSSLPFDPNHRTSSTVVRLSREQFFVTRGAPENILRHCRLNPSNLSKLSAWIETQSSSGCRVLAVARTPHSSVRPSLHPPRSLKLLGLVSFTDPVKKTAVSAVATAEKIGVGIRILTGDSLQVAAAVARQIGLINSPAQVMTGDQFESLSAADRLAALDTHLVFARTSPFQKNLIVDLLQTKYSVGYLGDGINDAIALESADVGLAVSNASQVARQAADIVLLEKDLNVIVEGIRQGRLIAANTSKYITATMASNFGNFYAVAVSSLFIPFLPMLPLQILALNLLSDFPMISVATDSVDSADIAYPTRFRVHSFIDLAMVLGVVSTLFDFLFFAVYFRISASVLQTNWFIGSILTELVFIYSIRTKKLFFRSTWPSLSLVILTVAAIALTLALPFTSIGTSVFGFSAPGIRFLALDILLVIAYFITTESVKLVYFRFRRKPAQS